MTDPNATPSVPAAPNNTAEPEKKPTLSDEKNLVVAFIQFLRQRTTRDAYSADQIEGIEIAIQCLEAAFGIGDSNYLFQPSKPLFDIFVAAEGLPAGVGDFPAPTAEEINQANILKEEGNNLMKASQYSEAVAKYSDAIKLNRDPAYFCNRAAAYCRLDQFELAIQDCRAALALDENYSKAYARMGLALTCQHRYAQAVDAYRMAVKLDPEQECYKNNLKLAEDRVKEWQEQNRPGQQQEPNLFGGQMPDMGAFLNNPAMLNMARQLMSDPNIQNMMSQMMSGILGSGGNSSISNLIEAGQQLAQQMENTNPNFVEQLRAQFQSAAAGDPMDATEQNDSHENGTEPPPPAQ